MGKFACGAHLTIWCFCHERTSDTKHMVIKMAKNDMFFRFYSGGAPDWPPCDECRVGGIMGNEFSPKSVNAADDFVSRIG